jgi:polyhydroxyalkanoate synthesis regulator phasin
MKKKLVGTGLALGLVAGAGAGLVLELTGAVGASSRPAAVSAAVDATTPGAPADDAGRPDPSTRLQEVLKPLVADGTITQAQADKVVAALVAAKPIGDRHGGPMGDHGAKGGGRGIGFGGLDTVATTLGITAADVRTALQSGQSIADLAVSKGKTAQDMIDAVVKEVNTKIAARVTAGDLTQAEADKALTEITTRVTEFVNSTHPMGDRGFGGPGMGHHGNGNDSADNDTDGATDTTAPGTTSPATTVGG